MENRFNLYGNAEVIKDLTWYNEEIEKERAKETPDIDKISRLYREQLYRSMQLNNGFNR